MTKQQAYTKFYNYCIPVITKEASFYIRNTMDLEELVNDAFMRTCKKLHLYKPCTNASFKNWLRCLTRNMCLRYLERKKQLLYIDDLFNVEPTTKSVEELFIRKEIYKVFKADLKNYSDIKQKIMLLKFDAQLKTSEISRILNIPEGTIKSTIHRIIKKLISKYPKLCQ